MIYTVSDDLHSVRCYTEAKVDEDRAKAMGLTIRRFLVSFKREVVQITRIGSERPEATQ